MLFFCAWGFQHQFHYVKNLQETWNACSWTLILQPIKLYSVLDDLNQIWPEYKVISRHCWVNNTQSCLGKCKLRKIWCGSCVLVYYGCWMFKYIWSWIHFSSSTDNFFLRNQFKVLSILGSTCKSSKRFAYFMHHFKLTKETKVNQI